ncbi:DUF3071 domain-containing protein, partial [Bacillus sp. S34]|nr:DUF3071 domain-containing protein [Bacillus sp. S34]
LGHSMGGKVASVVASRTVDGSNGLFGLRAVVLLAVGVPVLVLLMGVVTWVVTGRSLRPVERMRNEVETIRAARPDARIAVPATGDEIARLADTMNAMLDRLDRSAEGQRRFVSDASHELRSPIATIRQHAEVAAALDVDVEYGRRFEGPVLAERAFILDAAHRVAVTPVDDEAPDTFGEAITAKLEAGCSAPIGATAIVDADTARARCAVIRPCMRYQSRCCSRSATCSVRRTACQRRRDPARTSHRRPLPRVPASAARRSSRHFRTSVGRSRP